MAGTTPLSYRFQTASEDLTFTPTGRLFTSSMDTLRQAILAGHGVAQIIDLHIQAELARGELEVLLPDYEHAPRELYALYTREKAGLPKVRAMLDFVTDALGSKVKPARKKR